MQELIQKLFLERARDFFLRPLCPSLRAAVCRIGVKYLVDRKGVLLQTTTGQARRVQQQIELGVDPALRRGERIENKTGMRIKALAIARITRRMRRNLRD